MPPTLFVLKNVTPSCKDSEMKKNEDLWKFNTRDLMRASTCSHCTTLSVLHDLKDAEVEARLQPHIKKQKEARAEGTDKTLPQRYGDEFEDDLTQELKGSFSPRDFARPEKDGDFAQTVALMEARIPVIYQGGLEHRGEKTLFLGKPDFLVLAGWELFFEETGLRAQKTDGDITGGYSVWDAKYSSHTKPEYALQVAIYIEALRQAGHLAENVEHGLILGNRTLLALKEYEIVPATRLAREQLEATIHDVQVTDRAELLADFTWHCSGNKQCEICEYPEQCKDNREATSDLLLVAGLGKSLRDKLLNAGITTLGELANTELSSVKDVSKQSFERFKAQAKIQETSRSSGKPEHELLPSPMLQYLPKPDPMDVFFDMEGFPYFRDGGLEYLFGNWTRDAEFVEFWAVDRKSEKTSFIEFMQWLDKRMNENPAAHIYHYASYERTALRKLANRHAVMTEELAKLELDHRFVDLYPIVTKSIRVGEPRYSIKNLERHYDFEREADVTNANASIDEFAVWRDLEHHLANDPDLADRKDLQRRSAAAYKALRDYNTEDVISTMMLYDWLLTLDSAATKPWETVFYKPEVSQSAGLTDRELKLLELESITAFLFDPISDYEKGKNSKMDLQVEAWEALAHSILFYKREEVMFWADLNVRMTYDNEQLTKDREALVIDELREETSDGLSIDAEHSGIYRVQIEPDELFSPKAGMAIAIRYESEPGIVRFDFGSVVSNDSGSVVFNRKADNPESLSFSPTAIFDTTQYRTEGKQHFLNETAREITAVWGDPFSEPPEGFAILDLLLRRPPRLSERLPLMDPDSSDYLPALINTAERMDGAALAVQGPPGTGKTYLASRLIKHLVENGNRVAVGTNSHAAVENLLDACIEAKVPSNLVMKAINTGSIDERSWNAFKSTGPLVTAMKRNNGGLVMGGTSFTLCNKQVRELPFDYLMIDEAAQYSLVDLIAASGIARNIILFGDPQQLAQVVQAVHPGGVENSALGHFMGDNSILPSDLGYFVEVTRRLHPEVNKVVSWLAYENRLSSEEKTKNNLIPNVEPGIHVVELEHTGNSTHSTEEVAEVLAKVREHISVVSPEEILIVAPYNNQVNAIRAALDKEGFEDVRVGTVDKFQGQEGMLLIISLACSSADDAPRGLDFLLDRNRLNVAISRAKSVCYLIYSKNLLSASFRTIEDVKSVSRLAGLKDFSH